MYTSFHTKAIELDDKFLKTLKKMFGNKNISITVEEELDETEYLLSTPANRKALEKSLKDAKEGKLTKVNIDKLK